MARRFRTRVGESLETVEKHNTPLEEATTSSLDALRAYSAGKQEIFSSGNAKAIPFFKRAVKIDPKFASAYAMLARLYADLGESALSIENISFAYQLRDHATDRERFRIALDYDLEVTGDLESALSTGELWALSYPRDRDPRVMLCVINQQLGRYEKSVDEGERALSLDKESYPPAYINLAWSYLFSNRIDQTQSTLRRATEHHLEMDQPDFILMRYDIAFLQNDSTGMGREMALATNNPEAEHWLTERQANVLAFSGHLREARAMSHRAINLAMQSRQGERAALYRAGSAVREGLFGNIGEAKAAASLALKASTNRDVEFGAAFALALSGERGRAQSLTSDLERRFPKDTSVRFTYLPVLRAVLALDARNPLQAEDALRTATPYELGYTGSWFGFFGTLSPVYVRGLAYLDHHEGQLATAELQKVIDHPGIVASDPVGALAYLQLGRAYRQWGDNQRAKSSYAIFLKNWQNADPEIPILKQARAEASAMNLE